MAVSVQSAESVDVVSSIIAFESGELSDAGILRLFAHLVQTGLAWTLQGFYGRTARDLIVDGWLTRAGQLTAKGQAVLDAEKEG